MGQRTPRHRPAYSTSLTSIVTTGNGLFLWLALTVLSLTMMVLSSHNVPATPWAGDNPSHAQHMMFWDSGWYERIERDGYPSILPLTQDATVAPNQWAFLPVFPLLTHVVMMTGLPFAWAGFSVSVCASLGAWILLQHMMRNAGFSQSVCLWASACTWLLPWGIILQVPYAEALGFFFLLLACVAMQKGLWGWAVIPILLAGLTRPLAVPLALCVTLSVALLWIRTPHCPISSHHRGGENDPRGTVASSSLQQPQHWSSWAFIAVVFSWAGAGLWPLIAAWRTGTIDAYTATETAWRGGDLIPFASWFMRAGQAVGSWLAPFLLITAGLGVFFFIGALRSGRTHPGHRPASAVSSSQGMRTWLHGVSAEFSARPSAALVWVWCASYALYLLVVFDPTTSLIRLLLPLAPVLWPVMTRLSVYGKGALVAASFATQLWWLAWIWNLGSVSIQWIP